MLTPLKQVFYRIAASPWNPLPRWWGIDGTGCIGIITVHGVHSHEMARMAHPPTSSISVSAFEANLKALLRSYSVISLDEAVAMLTGAAPWRERCVVLTFDDSLQCTLEVAAPVLQRLGITATVFISTGIIDAPSLYWWLRLDYAVLHAPNPQAEVQLASGHQVHISAQNRRQALAALKSVLRKTLPLPRDAIVEGVEGKLGLRLADHLDKYPFAKVLSWDGVRRLVSLGMKIGSHTVTHPNLSLLSAEETYQELTSSKLRLENEVQLPCTHVCYPYGGFTAQVCKLASAVGFHSAMTTRYPGWNSPMSDLWALNRFAMPGAAGKLPYLMSGMTLGRGRK